MPLTKDEASQIAAEVKEHGFSLIPGKSLGVCRASVRQASPLLVICSCARGCKRWLTSGANIVGSSPAGCPRL